MATIQEYAIGYLGMEIIIEPGRVNQEYARDLWRYRTLFSYLAWKEILVRYKQTVFGIAWALIRPLALMLAFTLVFHKIAQLSSESVPYYLFVLAALLPWMVFAGGISEGALSIVENEKLISKVYFPRIIIPLASIAVCMLDFIVCAVMLSLLMVYEGIYFTSSFLFLPVALLMELACVAGCAMFFSALNVRYRDFRYALPFVIQFGLYVSPVGFSSSAVPEKWSQVFALNPMVGIIDGFRYAFFGIRSPLFVMNVGVSILVSLLLLAGGFLYFRSAERAFADVI